MLIVGACFVSKYLVIIAGLTSMVYMFSGAKWYQKFSFFMFILSFSPIFKLSSEQTSLFMFLRVAVIASFIFQQKGKFSFKFITLLIAFCAYCLLLSEIYKTSYIVPLINFAIWIIVGYIIANTLTSDVSTPVTRSLANGIIVTGIIGLFINEIPQLKNQINVLTSLTEGGVIIYRYAGFWNDPNYFTVLLSTSLWLVYFEYNAKKVSAMEFLLRCFIMTFLGLMTMSKSCILILVVFWIYVIYSRNDINVTSKVSIVFVIIVSAIIFLWRNPYWLTDILYRFTAGNEETTINTLTTGRTNIWQYYITKLADDFSWIFGRGVNAELLVLEGLARGSHNTYIQMLYTFGFFGTILYVSVFKKIYSTSAERFKKSIFAEKKPEHFILWSILITMFFLDGVYIEMYYYLIPMAFVYMLGTEKDLVTT